MLTPSHQKAAVAVGIHWFLWVFTLVAMGNVKHIGCYGFSKLVCVDNNWLKLVGGNLDYQRHMHAVAYMASDMACNSKFICHYVMDNPPIKWQGYAWVFYKHFYLPNLIVHLQWFVWYSSSEPTTDSTQESVSSQPVRKRPKINTGTMDYENNAKKHLIGKFTTQSFWK